MPSAALTHSLTLELEKEGGRALERKEGNRNSLALGSAPRRQGAEICWQRPRWIRNPRVERTSVTCPTWNPGHLLPCPLCHKSQETTARGGQREWLGTERVLTVHHNPPRDPERQEKESHAFKELQKSVANSEPSSLRLQCSQ